MKSKTFLIIILTAFTFSSLAEEKLTIKTYYPSVPAGEESIRLIPDNNPPSPSQEGQVYYEDSSNGLYYYDGSSWQSVGTGGGTAINALDAADGNPTDVFWVNNDGQVVLNTTPSLVSSGVIARGIFGSGPALDTANTTGAGTRLIWYPRRGAFRAGRVSASQWDDTVANRNIGNYSFATGYDTMATGFASLAMGYSAIASGTASFASGYDTVASGNYSTALGYETVASGEASIVGGYQTRALSKASIAMGYNTTAGDLAGGVNIVGNYSAAFGYETAAKGEVSFATGYKSQALGDHSVAIGSNVSVSGKRSIVLGQGVDDSNNRLVNNIDSSLMAGFNSDIPTLFIGASSGIGTTGNIGIGITDPTSKIDIDSGAGGGYQLRLRNSYKPTGGNDANGTVGDITWGQDGSNYYIYLKTVTGWKRALLTGGY